MKYSFLLKGSEDLRLDERVMQLLSISNDLYDCHGETASRALRARHYAVTPLSRKSGLIQWIEGVVSLFKISESRFTTIRRQAEEKHKDNDDERKKKDLESSHGVSKFSRFKDKTITIGVFRSNHS